MDHDLEATPIRILTNTVLGKHEVVVVEVKNSGLLRIDFRFKRFNIDSCGLHNFPTSILEELDVNKEWTISKTDKALTVLCNEVEALNLVFDEVDIYCTRAWSKDVTQIKFRNEDSATDYWKKIAGGNK